MAKKTVKKKKKKAAARKKTTTKKVSQAASVTTDPAKWKITPHPTAGPKVEAFEQKLDEQIAGDEIKPKRGRPRKVIEPEPEASLEFVQGALQLPFELWSIGQGVDELALSDVEARQLAEPVKQLLDHYLPSIPAIAYAWCSCAVSIFWIMRPRILKIQDLKKQQSSSEAKGGKEAGSGQGGPPTSQPPGEGRIIEFPGPTKPQKL